MLFHRVVYSYGLHALFYIIAIHNNSGSYSYSQLENAQITIAIAIASLLYTALYKNLFNAATCL